MEAGFPTPGVTLRSTTCKHLGVARTGLSIPDGTPSHTLKRADLSKAIHDEAASGGIAVEHGKRLVDVVEPPGDGVRALFEDGSKATGEVLVGADGIHLVARRRIDPNAPAATYAGLINLGGYARGVHVDAEPGPVPPGSPEERDQNHVIEALEEVRRLGWPTGLSAFLRASELGKIAMLICGFPAR